jgi:hypothetical protein
MTDRGNQTPEGEYQSSVRRKHIEKKRDDETT